MKKRFWAGLLALLFSFSFCMAAYAADGNIDDGQGDMGGSTDHGSWSRGRDGVRISIVNADSGALVKLNDFTNASCYEFLQGQMVRAFVKKNKLQYKSGTGLAAASYGVVYYLPGMPTIIGSGNSNLAAIKAFFTSEGTIKDIASSMQFDYERLISGEYKLLLEPIAYFTYEGALYAMTATEAAMFDAKVDGALYTWMNALTHQNLPLSMFLERADLGLSAYGGPVGMPIKDNSTIINQLGCGIVSFDGKDVPDVTPEGGDYTFRTDTDVIVSVHFQNNGADITPDDDAYINLNIGGKNYQRQFVCPAGGNQLVWVKWHTPTTQQKVDITATCDDIPRLNKTLTADIVEIKEVPPPDPTYYDRNSGFTLKSAPDYGNKTSASWREWYAYWIHDPAEHQEKDWIKDPNPEIGATVPPDSPDGSYGSWLEWTWVCDVNTCDTPKEHGHWEFDVNSYSANLSVNFKISQDDRNPTAYGSVMKSGYGVQANAEVAVTTSGKASTYDVTPVQNAITLFSEFGYASFDRFLETDSSHSSGYRAAWHFKANEYSYYGSRVHFTPLWYPDNTNYVVGAVLFDCWTPAGQLYVTQSSSLMVYESCLDDWYIRIIK